MLNISRKSAQFSAAVSAFDRRLEKGRPAGKRRAESTRPPPGGNVSEGISARFMMDCDTLRLARWHGRSTLNGAGRGQRANRARHVVSNPVVTGEKRQLQAV